MRHRTRPGTLEALQLLRRQPGIVLCVVAMVLAIIIYAPTLATGLVSFDDPWLYRDNFVLQHPSWTSLGQIFFELDAHSPVRYALGVEYLPVRDLSVMLDFAVWGDTWAGFHATNLILYLAAIGLVFAMLDGFGVDRVVCGIAVLIWAVHPSHAESVAWLSERKGLLGAVFAALTGLGYARYRSGRSSAWLGLAAVAAVCAVWSKAPAAFAVACIAVLEVALPGRRVSWRRSLVGLGVIAVVGIAAFVPVVITASREGVTSLATHVDRLGVHGFYIELAAMAVKNAASYAPPDAFDDAIGVIAAIAILAVAIVPARGRWAPPGELRAAAGIWLVGLFPASHLVLGLQHTVADRYALWPTLGVALAIAVGVMRLPRSPVRHAIVAAITLAGVARSLDARESWRDSQSLWTRAVESNPDDGDAWSMAAEALADAGRPDLAAATVDAGLARTHAPRLLLRRALLLLAEGRRAEALPVLEEAARGGEPRAMENYALLEMEDGHLDVALPWARNAAALAPRLVAAQRNYGRVALAARRNDEALAAFTTAYGLEPQNLANRYNLALALIATNQRARARPHLEACLADPKLHDRAAAALAEYDPEP